MADRQEIRRLIRAALAVGGRYRSGTKHDGIVMPDGEVVFIPTHKHVQALHTQWQIVRRYERAARRV